MRVLWALNESEHAAYVSEPDADRAKLAKLKSLIRQRSRVETYERPGDIVEKVTVALDTLLELRFPETETPDAFTLTSRLHQAYARDRRVFHIGSEGYYRLLDRWADAENAGQMLITGASGCGKSTLIANWIQTQRSSDSTGQTFIFEHYIGASSDSADPIRILRRFWEHLNRATGETLNPPSETATLMDLSTRIAQRLSHARLSTNQNEARFIIAIDGLDKLASQKDLRWLFQIPGIHVLVSSLDGEAKTAALENGFEQLDVKPLGEKERRDFIVGTLERWRRSLEPKYISRILEPAAAELAGSPLYLKTVLEELRVSADHARLSERLEDYALAGDMPELFNRVLKRIEEDCEPGLVAKALPLVWASRAGLEETEIITITGQPPIQWATIRNGLGDGLRDSQGRIAFGHDYLSQAVANRYLGTSELMRTAHLMVADHFESDEPSQRQAEELPFQLLSAAKLGAEEAWSRLKTLLLDLNRFELFWERGNDELWSYWLPLKELGHDPEALLCEAFQKHSGEADEWTQTQFDLAFQVSQFLNFAGATGNASLALEERLCAACEHRFGPEDHRTLTSMDNLAGTLKVRGNFSGAQGYYERVLEVRNRILGPEHPATLISRSNLAGTLYERGNLSGAQINQERVLEIRDRIFGADHPDTLQVMNNLATTLKARGDLDGAQTLCQRVLEARMRLLGSEHPDTIFSMSNLAETLSDSRNYAEAQIYQERVLEAHMRTLGPEHRDTLISMSNLSGTLYNRGDIEGAQAYQERALEARTRVLGTDHPDTLVSMNNLAGMLSARGDFDSAKAYEERALEARIRVLGHEHPDTLTTMNNLATTLHHQGDLAGALIHFKHVLNVRNRVLGPDHPHTLSSMSNVAATLSARKDFIGALNYFEQVLEARIRLLGADHPDTKISFDWVVLTKAEMGKW